MRDPCIRQKGPLNGVSGELCLLSSSLTAISCGEVPFLPLPIRAFIRMTLWIWVKNKPYGMANRLNNFISLVGLPSLFLISSNSFFHHLTSFICLGIGQWNQGWEQGLCMIESRWTSFSQDHQAKDCKRSCCEPLSKSKLVTIPS